MLFGYGYECSELALPVGSSRLGTLVTLAQGESSLGEEEAERGPRTL